ncbi:kinase-like domain-containing protein [Suillus ampliporus]|nr:kinase-like domain-containing protein [Suillus ampliporus]
MPSGTLDVYLKEATTLTASAKVGLVKGVADGLNYLHSAKVIHGDLHPADVLIDGSGNPRLTDFGLATVAGDPELQLNSTTAERSFNSRWHAPEQTGAPTRRRPFKLVCPKRQPHVQYYGYAVAPEWMVQFAEKHWPEALPDRNDKRYEHVAMTRAFELIRDWIPLYTLAGRDCFNPPAT